MIVKVIDTKLDFVRISNAVECGGSARIKTELRTTQQITKKILFKYNKSKLVAIITTQMLFNFIRYPPKIK